MAKITLAAARINAGYSQENLAKLIGVTRSTLARWETGKTEIKAKYLCAFCKHTGFSVEDILLPKKYT